MSKFLIVRRPVQGVRDLPLASVAILLMVASAVLNLGYARRFAGPAGTPDSWRVRLFKLSGWLAIVAAVLTGLSMWFV